MGWMVRTWSWQEMRPRAGGSGDRSRSLQVPQASPLSEDSDTQARGRNAWACAWSLSSA